MEEWQSKSLGHIFLVMTGSKCSKKWAGNELTLYMAGRSFDIVGGAVLSVNGIITPRPALQNILGDNWPTPPLKIDHVSYVYVSGDEQVQNLADQYGAQFRQESVYTDGNR